MSGKTTPHLNNGCFISLLHDVPQGDRRRSAVDRSHQRGIAASSGRVDAGYAFGRKASDIVRSARLGPGAGKAFAAERLAFDHRADLVAIDVQVADARALLDKVSGRVDPALQAERQAVPRGINVLDDLAEALGGEADDMQDRPEILTVEFVQRADLEHRGSNEGAALRFRRKV